MQRERGAPALSSELAATEGPARGKAGLYGGGDQVYWPQELASAMSHPSGARFRMQGQLAQFRRR